jgi:hypothetical protein
VRKQCEGRRYNVRSEKRFSLLLLLLLSLLARAGVDDGSALIFGEPKISPRTIHQPHNQPAATNDTIFQLVNQR